MRSRDASLPLNRCNASNASTSMSWSFSRELSNNVSTACAKPSWTQTQSGNRLRTSVPSAVPRSTGRSASTTFRRRLGSEKVFTSSSKSGANRAAPWHKACTAGMFRCCNAANNGDDSAVSAFTSALASRSKAIAVGMEASAALQAFIAKRPKHVAHSWPWASASSSSSSSSFSSHAPGSAPAARASRTTSRSTARSSSCDWRNSCSKRFVAAAVVNSLNRSSPTRSRMRSAICRRLSSLPWLLWSAMRTSSPISSSCDALRSKASAAVAQPDCTQTQSGSFMFASPSTCGRRWSSMVWRLFLHDTDFNSSSTSGVTFAPRSHKTETATSCRDRMATSNGTGPSMPGVVWLMSARAFTSASIMVRTEVAEALEPRATRPSGVCISASSSSSLPSSPKLSSSLLSSSLSSPDHSHSRPHTQFIFMQPSLRIVGTPQPGQTCASRAFSACSRSLQSTPLCHVEILHLKQNRSPQQGVRCRGKRCIHASCTASRRSPSWIHNAWPVEPKILLNFDGGDPPRHFPLPYSSRRNWTKASAESCPKKHRDHAARTR
mmetsp:Transcript_125068/g.361797  ORF Transcript_125068/g.361797 Transcript_125068/m.361797 type:complete len:550 (-) Transcript_125068:993-2642(-)